MCLPTQLGARSTLNCKTWFPGLKDRWTVTLSSQLLDKNCTQTRELPLSMAAPCINSHNDVTTILSWQITTQPKYKDLPLFTLPLLVKKRGKNGILLQDIEMESEEEIAIKLGPKSRTSCVWTATTLLISQATQCTLFYHVVFVLTRLTLAANSCSLNCPMMTKGFKVKWIDCTVIWNIYVLKHHKGCLCVVWGGGG